MVYAMFTKNMEKMLADLKGYELISYDCAQKFDTAYGNLRLNTSHGSVEILNLQKSFPFLDAEEDIACFSCKKVDGDITFEPYCIESFETFSVNETIKEIDILNDTININNGEYIISLDTALILRTEKRTFMFAKDVWFSEVIHIASDDDYEKIFSTEAIRDSWSNDGDYTVHIIRNRRRL